jgi:hypothetical protein
MAAKGWPEVVSTEFRKRIGEADEVSSKKTAITVDYEALNRIEGIEEVPD